jgi:hypothetical protein
MAENVARQFAERGAAVAEEAKKGMEHAYSTASKGAVDFNLQLIDMMQANTNAAFDFARQLARVKSPAEFFEVSTAHMQKQLESVAQQTQHFTAMAQKATAEAAQPFQAGVAKLRAS